MLFKSNFTRTEQSAPKRARRHNRGRLARTCHRRPIIESLERRSMMAAISISDAVIDEQTALSPFTIGDAAVLENSADILFGPSRNGDSIDDLYVAGRFSDNVVVYDGATGAFIEEFVGPASGLDSAVWLAIGPDGDLFVPTATVTDTVDAILRVDQATKAVSTFVSSASGGLAGAKGMAFGPDGNLYVASVFSDQVLRYDGVTGSYMDEFVLAGSGGLDGPAKLLFGPDRNGDAVEDLFVSSSLSDEILIFSGADGTLLEGIVAGLVPHDMKFGPDGNLYVVQSGTSDEQVYRFDGTNGAFMDVVLPAGSVGPETSFITFDHEGNLYISSERSHDVFRFDSGPLVTLSSPSVDPVTIDFSTRDGSATGGADYGTVSGRLAFAPGETTKRILLSGLQDNLSEGTETFTVELANPNGATIGDAESTISIVDSPPTKFYVVNDAAGDSTFEYDDVGAAGESYALGSGNTAPRGAASTAAGDRVWVVDGNKTVYVYHASGTLFGSWAAGSLSRNAQVQGIATDGTDIWIVDAAQDKVFRYANAASRLSGSQGAASSFSLNKNNKNPKDVVTDGTHLWVVEDSTTDKVFKYTLTGSLVASWTISTSLATSPTGITLDPSNPAHLWIVDNGMDTVYEYANAVNQANGSSKSGNAIFLLAAGNMNPQGIADPPAGGPTASLGSPAPTKLSARTVAALARAAASPSAGKPLQKPIVARSAPSMAPVTSANQPLQAIDTAVAELFDAGESLATHGIELQRFEVALLSDFVELL